jgi:hypothetical protein
MRHDHAEQDAWPNERLSERLAELTEINQPWQHSPERIYQIRKEMSIISFEQLQRYSERYNGNRSE